MPVTTLAARRSCAPQCMFFATNHSQGAASMCDPPLAVFYPHYGLVSHLLWTDGSVDCSHSERGVPPALTLPIEDPFSRPEGTVHPCCQVWVYSGRGSSQVRTKTDENRGQVWAEVSPGWSCDQLDSTTRTMSVDPLRRFQSGGDRDGDRQGDRSSDLDDFRLRCTR